MTTEKQSSKKAAPVVAYKGFDASLRCRHYQYEIGKTYHHEGGVVRCQAGGFHACEYPLDVFNYYGPATSRYATVELSGDIDRGDGKSDTKIAAATIAVSAELKIPDLVLYAVGWIKAKIDTKIDQVVTANASTNTGYRSASTNTGNYSASTNTGNWSAATNTGDWSASTNTGYWSASTNTGNQSAATNTGEWSAATNTGDYSAATNTGDYSASTNTGNRSAAMNTGNRSTATNTGGWSASTNTGNYSASTNTGSWSAATVEGEHSVAIATGRESKAKASAGSAIVLTYRNDDYELVHIRAGIAGKDVKADTFYVLDANGEFQEAK